MKSYLFISFDTPDIPARLAVLTRLLELGGRRLARGQYLLESEDNGAGLYAQLEAMLTSGHLWVMHTWQRPEASYLARMPARLPEPLAAVVH